MQRSSTKLRVDAPHQEQLALLAPRKPSRPVDLAEIANLHDTNDALDYACRLASVRPKEITIDMDCDKSTWSRICSGEWDLDGRDIPRFNKVIGNSAYLLYLNHLDGWDLGYMRKRQSTEERQLAEQLKEVSSENADLRTRNAFLENLVVQALGGQRK